MTDCRIGETAEAIDSWKKAVEVAKDTPFEKELSAKVVEKIKTRGGD